MSMKCKTMCRCPSVYETDCKLESALSFNDNVSVYDIMNVSSVLGNIETAQNKCVGYNGTHRKAGTISQQGKGALRNMI